MAKFTYLRKAKNIICKPIKTNNYRQYVCLSSRKYSITWSSSAVKTTVLARPMSAHHWGCQPALRMSWLTWQLLWRVTCQVPWLPPPRRWRGRSTNPRRRRRHCNHYDRTCLSGWLRIMGKWSNFLFLIILFSNELTYYSDHCASLDRLLCSRC